MCLLLPTMSIELGITDRDIEKIQTEHKKMVEKDIERITKYHVYITSNRFNCEKCGGINMRRSFNNGNNPQVTFRCYTCGHMDTHIYDKKQGKSVDYEEYQQVVDTIAKR